MATKPSYLDLRCHEFKCERAECGYVFKETLRRLEAAKEIKCPKCDAPVDLREAKLHGELQKALATAHELDAQ